MKILYTIQRIISCLLAVFFLTACEDMLTFDEKPILLSASGESVQTRAGTTIQGGNFIPGESINVFIVNHADANDIIANPAVFQAGAVTSGRNALNYDGKLYYPSGSGSQVDIYGLYPSTRTGDSFNGKFTVQTDQTSDANYILSDLMTAPVFTQSKTSEVVNLPFTHKMSKLIVTATPEAGYEVTGITLLGLNHTINYTPSTGVLGDLVEETGVEPTRTLMANGGAVLFPPQLVSKELFVLVYTKKDGVDGVAGFGVIGKNFEEGHQYSLNLAVGSGNVKSSESEITEPTKVTGWDEGEATVAPDGGEKGMYIAEDIADQIYVKDEQTGEGVPRTPRPVVKFGESGIDLHWYGEDDERNNYTLQYVDNVNVGNGKAQVLVMGLGYYAGLTAIKSFNITPARGEISYSKETVLKTFSYGGEVTEDDVVFNNNGDGDVTFSSNNTSVATVNSKSGKVTIQGVGEATITATVENVLNYDYGENTTASYTLNVLGYSAAGLEVVLEPSEFTYDGTAKRPGVTVYEKDAEGNRVRQLTIREKNSEATGSVDCEYEYQNNTNANTSSTSPSVAITCPENSNFSGETSKPFTINKGTPTIEIDDQTAMKCGFSSDSITRTAPNTRYVTIEKWAKDELDVSPSPTGYVIVTKTIADENFTRASDGAACVRYAINVTGINQNNITSTDSMYVSVVAKAISSSNVNATTTENSPALPIHALRAEWYYPYNGSTSGTTAGLTGTSRKWTCPVEGYYMLEVVGASGADVPSGSSSQGRGGRGARIKGRVKLNASDGLFVYVGGQGNVIPKGINVKTENRHTGGWNGGGDFDYQTAYGLLWSSVVTIYNSTLISGDPCCGGGGATDISVNGADKSSDWKSEAHLYSRIIVAGGGGGALFYERESGYANGGYGGAWIGEAGSGDDWGYGGTLSNGGERGRRSNGRISDDGKFGIGGGTYYWPEGGGCGGGGWYGGSGAAVQGGNASGGGGSSYAWSDDSSGEDADPYGGEYTTGIRKDKYSPRSFTFTIADQSKKLSTYYPEKIISSVSNTGVVTYGATNSYKPADRFKMRVMGKEPDVNTGHGNAKIIRLDLNPSSNQWGN